MLEAVYIADSKNTLVFEYLVSLQSPHFHSLQNIIRMKQNDRSNETLPLIQINSDYFVCLHKTKSIVIYLLCFNGEESLPNPVLPFVFINRLIEVMEDYFGTPLSVAKIEANNDTLMLLINDMIDNGIPHVTDFNKLRDLIPFKSFLSKFISNDLNLGPKKTPSDPFSKTQASIDSIPWRRSNVRHTNNEMYVDVVESVKYILKPTNSKQAQLNALNTKKYDSAFYSTGSVTTNTLVPVTGQISGQINLLSRLTGVPYLQMVLNVGGLKIDTPSFHPCIKIDKWMDSPGNLSFIPPDGQCTLMEYDIDFDNFSRKEQQLFLGLVQIDYQDSLGVGKNEFEIRLLAANDKAVSKFENVTVEVFTSEKHDVSIKANRITHGDFQYKGLGRGEWNLRNVVGGVQPLLRGSINSGEDFGSAASSLHEAVVDDGEKSMKPVYIKLSYSHKGKVPSGLTVGSLQILSAKGLGETVKPYKGVKYLTRASDIVVRS